MSSRGKKRSRSRSTGSRKRSPSKKREKIDKSTTYYCIDVDKTGRAKCRTCKRDINKEEVRVGAKFDKDQNAPYQWHHIRCLKPLMEMDLASVTGFNDLTNDQQKTVDDTIAKRKRREKAKNDGKEPEPDYYEMTVKQLKDELEKRRMWIDKERIKKDDYVHLLEKDDGAGGNGITFKGKKAPPAPKDKKVKKNKTKKTNSIRSIRIR